MFKKLIQATITASLAATPMIAASAEAQQYQPQRQQQQKQQRTVSTVQQRPGHTVVQKTTVVRQQPAHRGWNKGQRFDRRQAPNYRVIDYRQYRGRQLYAPPRGHQWVRSGNDAVLIATRSGTVAGFIRNALR